MLTGPTRFGTRLIVTVFVLVLFAKGNLGFRGGERHRPVEKQLEADNKLTDSFFVRVTPGNDVNKLAEEFRLSNHGLVSGTHDW